MPGLFDLLMAARGAPLDPTAQIRAGLGQAPGQAGGPPSPVPGAPVPQGGAPGGGGPPSPPSGGPQAAPGAAGAPPGGAPSGSPPATMPGGAQAPQALQSPSDLSQMYLQLAQRASAERSFNSGLAMIAAGAYPGRTPGGVAALSNAMNAGSEDPGAIMGNLMRLQMFNQQQRQYQAFQNAAGDYAKILGPGWTAQDIQALGPEGMRTIAGSLAGVSGDPATVAMRAAQRNWDQTHTSTDQQGNTIVQPRPDWMNDPLSYAAHVKETVTQQTTEAAQKTKDLIADQHDFSSTNADYTQTEQILGWLKAHPDATAAAVQQGAFAAGRTGQFRQWLGSLPGGLPPDTATAAGYISQLQGKLYGEGWKGRGGRLSQLEAGKISEGFSQLNNPAMPSDQINDQVGRLYDQTLQAHANTYGIAGMPTPSNLYGVMSPDYKDGGKLFAGATEVKGGGPSPAPSGGGSGATDLRNSKDPDADYAALPSGATFIGPDGKPRRKP